MMMMMVGAPVLLPLLLLLLLGAEGWSNTGRVDCTDPSRSSLPFCDRSLTAQARAADLVSRLSTDDMICQMTSDGTVRPAGPGLPVYHWWSEALHGVKCGGCCATTFPQPIGLGAAFNDTLWAAVGDVISTEARAMNNAGTDCGLTYFSPTINLYRDPRWGRGSESPGEDPTLIGRYATAWVNAMQGNGSSAYLKTLVTCKHFVGYSMEQADGTDRHHFNAVIDAQDMAETYLPPFQDCVERGGARSVMCSYNAVNGVPTCASTELLIQTLRNSWKFDGVIVSDAGAIGDICGGHSYAPDPNVACGDALNATCDLGWWFFYQNLGKALALGDVTQAELVGALTRQFTERMRLGMFDPPSMVNWDSIGPDHLNTPAAQELAVEAARQSMVLLKNRNGTLPLNQNSVPSIALIGPSANNTQVLLGSYYGQPLFTITPWMALEKAGMNVKYAYGCDITGNDQSGFAAAEAAASDPSVGAVVLVLGIDGTVEGEGTDRTDIGLPSIQAQLWSAVANAAGTKPMILVLVNGGPVALPDYLLSRADAVLEAWYPGQAGGTGVVDVLLGAYSPAGRLPVTVYYSNYTSQIKMTDMNMRPWPGRTHRYLQVPVQFAYGTGLSYSTFNARWHESVPLALSCSSPPATLPVVVTNHGPYPADYVLLVTLERRPAGPDVPTAALRETLGFRRVRLDVGVTTTVEVAVEARVLHRGTGPGTTMECVRGEHVLTIDGDSRPMSVVP